MSETSSHSIGKTLSHSAIYSIGIVMQKLAGFIMLPIYTRYLTPEDYGVVALILMVTEFMGIIIGLRITQAMFRYYALEDSFDGKKVIVSTVLVCVIVTSLVGVLILQYYALNVSQFLFGNTIYAYEIWLYSIVLMTQAIGAVGLAYLRAQRKPVTFLMVGVFTLILQISLNIFFVVVKELHVLGVIYSSLVSNGIIAALFFVFLMYKVNLRFSMPVAIKLYKFVGPLMIASLAGFYVYNLDKYMLRVYFDLSQVGIYTLALNIAGVLGMIGLAFNQTWAVDRFEIYKQKDSIKLFQNMFQYLIAALLISSLGISIFVKDLLIVMSNTAFHSAAFYVPFILVANILFAMSNYCNFGCHIKEETKHIAHAEWARAVVVTGGVLALIPLIEIYGAAITLIIGYTVQLTWIHIKSKQLFNLHLQWKPIIIMSLVALVFMLISLLLPNGLNQYFIIRILIFLVAVYTFYKLPIWNESQKLDIQKMMHLIFRKKKKI